MTWTVNDCSWIVKLFRRSSSTISLNLIIFRESLISLYFPELYEKVSAKLKRAEVDSDLQTDVEHQNVPIGRPVRRKRYSIFICSFWKKVVLCYGICLSVNCFVSGQLQFSSGWADTWWVVFINWVETWWIIRLQCGSSQDQLG